MIFKKLITFLLILVFGITIYGEESLSIDNTVLYDTPRQRALGGSDITFSRDAMPSSNPASISLDSLTKISIGYTGFYHNSFNTSGLSFVSTVDNRIGFGLSVAYLMIPDIQITNSFESDSLGNPLLFDQSKIDYKSASELNFNASLSYTILQKKVVNISVGGALRGMRRRLIDWTGYGIGFDLAATTEFNRPGITLGLLASDITTNYINWSSSYHSNALPRVYFGFGYEKNIPYIYGDIKVTYKSPDLLSNSGEYYSYIGSTETPKSGRVREEPLLLLSAASYGIEYIIYRVLAIRIGLDEMNRFNFGAGVNLFKRSLAFDFSYTTANELAGTYSLSASYNW